MLDDEICDMPRWQRQVCQALVPETTLQPDLVTFLDNEYNLSQTFVFGSRKKKKYVTGWPKHPFLSCCLRWENHTARYGPLLSKGAVQRFTLKHLLKWILICLHKWGAPLDENRKIVIVSHWAISEMRFAQGIEEEEILATGTFFSGQFTQEGFKFRIVDSYGLFQTSLEKLTTETPIPKVKITQRDREDPYSHWKRAPNRFWIYAETDVRSLQWSCTYWRKYFWDTYGVDIYHPYCLTAATIGTRIFRQRFMHKPVALEPYEDEDYADEKGGVHTRTIFDHKLRDLRYLACRAYKGAMRDTFIRGISEGDIKHFDFEKLYVTSAIACPMPRPDSVFHKIESVADLDYPGWVSICHFVHPDGTTIPVLPVYDKRFRKLVFPLEGETECTTFEAKLARDNGVQLEGLNGWYFTEPYDTRVRDFMQEILKQTHNFKDHFGEKLFKGIGVGFVGKLIQHIQVEQLENRTIRYYKIGPTFSPLIACLVLGFARTAELSALRSTATPVYAHTDSITCLNCEPDQSLPIIQTLRDAGSGGLPLKWSAKKFWSARAAVYYARDNEGKQHAALHGIPGKTKNLIPLLEGFVERPDKILPEGVTAVKIMSSRPVTWKEHLNYGLSLSSEVIRKVETPFAWDDKRRLVESPSSELRSLFTTGIKTVPWRNIEEILETVKTRGHKATISSELKRLTGKPGRPRVITDGDKTRIMEMHKAGESNRRISKQYPQYGHATIDRFLTGASKRGAGA